MQRFEFRQAPGGWPLWGARAGWSCVLCLTFAALAHCQETDRPATPEIQFVDDGKEAEKTQAAAPSAPSDRALPMEKQESPFLRVLRGPDRQPLALETSIVRYRPASGTGEITVDLIGAIHVGDALYYEKLNQIFSEYDVVLYELVAPEGERPSAGGNSENPLAMLQGLLTSGLGLESQLAKIDYSKENFVHADLSPEQIAEVMRKRGDNGFTIALGVMADMIRAANLREMAESEEAEAEPSADEPAEGVGGDEESIGEGAEEVDLLSMLFDPDSPRKMKLAMAEQFADTQQIAQGLGPTLNTLIVEDRNQAALKVLQKQLASGKKKIAIFYGAAHMPDFEKRLVADFDLKRQDVTWITAWDLTKRSDGFQLPQLLRDLAPALRDLTPPEDGR